MFRLVMPYLYKGKDYFLLGAVSYCMYKTDDRHFKVRPSTTNVIINEWKCRMSIVKLEICEPSVEKTMQRNSMRLE